MTNLPIVTLTVHPCDQGNAERWALRAAVASYDRAVVDVIVDPQANPSKIGATGLTRPGLVALARAAPGWTIMFSGFPSSLLYHWKATLDPRTFHLAVFD